MQPTYLMIEFYRKDKKMKCETRDNDGKPIPIDYLISIQTSDRHSRTTAKTFVLNRDVLAVVCKLLFYCVSICERISQDVSLAKNVNKFLDNSIANSKSNSNLKTKKANEKKS